MFKTAFCMLTAILAIVQVSANVILVKEKVVVDNDYSISRQNDTLIIENGVTGKKIHIDKNGNVTPLLYSKIIEKQKTSNFPIVLSFSDSAMNLYLGVSYTVVNWGSMKALNFNARNGLIFERNKEVLEPNISTTTNKKMLIIDENLDLTITLAEDSYRLVDSNNSPYDKEIVGIFLTSSKKIISTGSDPSIKAEREKIRQEQIQARIVANEQKMQRKRDSKLQKQKIKEAERRIISRLFHGGSVIRSFATVTTTIDNKVYYSASMLMGTDGRDGKMLTLNNVNETEEI